MHTPPQTAMRYFGGILFLLILPFFLSAQEIIDSAQYRAVYTFSYKTKPEQTEFAKTDLMYLNIGQKATKFYSRNEQIRDSVMFDGLDKGLSIYQVNDNRSEEAVQMPRWIMGGETKEILSYFCQKATAECAGRKWTVFFTPEIPINKGPFKLWGLPGLVVEAQDSNDFFYFSLNSFEKLSEQIGIVYTHTTYSEKEYDKISRKDS